MDINKWKSVAIKQLEEEMKKSEKEKRLNNEDK